MAPQDPPPPPVPSNPAEDAARAEIRAELAKEAKAYASGEMVTLPHTRTIRVPDGTGYHTRVNTSLGFLGGYSAYGYGFTGGYSYSVRNTPNTKKVRVPAEDSPVKIVYPSPGDASPAQVLEAYLQDNLYKGELRFQKEKSLPLLSASVQAAHTEAAANPTKENLESERRMQESALRAYDMIALAEKEYKERLTAGEDRDKAALDIIKGLYESKDGNPVLEGAKPNAASLLVLAGGNGRLHHFGDADTTFDGSTAQLFNYYRAIQRNKDKYAGNGKKYGDYFAQAPQGSYAPPQADRISPADTPTVGQDAERRRTQLMETLDETVRTLRSAAVSLTEGRFVDSSARKPAPVADFLEKVKEDIADDGALGNPKPRQDGMSYRTAAAFLPDTDEIRAALAVRQLSGDASVRAVDLGRLEKDRQIVVDALEDSTKRGAEPLSANPQIVEAFQRYSEAIELEFSTPRAARTPKVQGSRKK